MSRKKTERNRRSKEEENSPPPTSADSPVANSLVSHGELSDIRSDMDGMLMFFTGVKDKMEFCEIREKCRSFGRELNRDSGLEGKNANISSRSFEAEENCSSRSFCT
jgi:hypothetical protein